MTPKNNVPLVIFAEDDHEDWVLIEDTLSECGGLCKFERVENGLELVERLKDKNNLPTLIMLDLRMPKMDGQEALSIIKKDNTLKHIPIVVMTTSNTDEDILGAYTKGANSFVVKPVTFDSMKEVLGKIHSYWAGVATLPPA